MPSNMSAHPSRRWDSAESYVGVPRSFHAYSRVSISLLVVLCWSMGLIPMDPTQITQHAFYYSPLHLSRPISLYPSIQSQSFSVYPITGHPEIDHGQRCIVSMITMLLPKRGFILTNSFDIYEPRHILLLPPFSRQEIFLILGKFNKGKYQSDFIRGG